MSDAKSQAEPSMEEILASIRRIISEDAEAEAEPRSAPSAATGRERGDVLTLTQPLEEGAVEEVEPPARPALTAKTAPLEASRDKADIDLSFDLDEPPDMDDDPSSFEESSYESGLMSRAAAGAASEALSKLDQAMATPLSLERSKRLQNPSSDFSGAMTVEQLVAQTLKPILRDWLDANLPAMVEDMVQAEIHRLTQSRRR